VTLTNDDCRVFILHIQAFEDVVSGKSV